MYIYHHVKCMYKVHGLLGDIGKRGESIGNEWGFEG